jgi:hypothetical protein
MITTLNNHVFKGHRALLGSKYVTYREIELPTRYELFPLSSNGFDWGNGGKASQQLAFAMLYELSNEELATKYATQFANSVVNSLASRDWLIAASEVIEWIEKNCDEPTFQKLAPVNKVTKKAKKLKTNVVKEICKELSITQKYLAEILEVPEGTVSSWAVKNEIPRLGKKAIEFYMINVKNQKIVDSYRSFKNLLEIS